MSEIKTVFQLPTLPGIKRDGTLVDGDNWSDGQWVRFQRGKVRKMGGMVQLSPFFSGIARALYLWPLIGSHNLTSYGQYGIEQATLDDNGDSGSVIDRTPSSGFTPNSDIMWSVDSMFDAAAGSNKSLILAVPTHTAIHIDDRTETTIFWADPTDTTPFSNAGVDANGVTAGGLYVNSPYVTLYGVDGKVTWSNANEPKNYTTGDAGTARVTSLKIVKGLPLRTGSGPGGLLWALDSVIRQDWIGGSQIFRFSTITNKSTILSQNSVIEYDGVYYWVGIDRFLVSNGAQVSELPNQMNVNWFFDNLNHDARQKVWAMKVPRFGEIWWFFPFGTATECTNAVIYNVREQTWYDVTCSRGAGFSSQVFRFPIMSNNATEDEFRITLSGGFTTAPPVGAQVEGSTSGATALVNFYEPIEKELYLTKSTSNTFVVGETVTSTTMNVGASPPSVVSIRQMFDAYTHEHGRDLVEDGTVSAICAWAETNDFGLPTGGMQVNAPQGLNRWTRLVRVEPDFIMSGEIMMTVIGREFPQSPDVDSGDYTFGPNTGKIDTREQFRCIRLRFESHDRDGYFEQGRIILHTEPGDVRS